MGWHGDYVGRREKRRNRRRKMAVMLTDQVHKVILRIVKISRYRLRIILWMASTNVTIEREIKCPDALSESLRESFECGN